MADWPFSLMISYRDKHTMFFEKMAHHPKFVSHRPSHRPCLVEVFLHCFLWKEKYRCLSGSVEPAIWLWQLFQLGQSRLGYAQKISKGRQSTYDLPWIWSNKICGNPKLGWSNRRLPGPLAIRRLPAPYESCQSQWHEPWVPRGPYDKHRGFIITQMLHVWNNYVPTFWSFWG